MSPKFAGADGNSNTIPYPNNPMLTPKVTMPQLQSYVDKQIDNLKKNLKATLKGHFAQVRTEIKSVGGNSTQSFARLASSIVALEQHLGIEWYEQEVRAGATITKDKGYRKRKK